MSSIEVSPQTIELNAKTDFQNAIEDLVWEHDISYIEAITLHCEKQGIEIEVAAALAKNLPVLKSALAEEATALNILKKSAKLPV